MTTELAPVLYSGDKPHHILEAQQFSPEWLTTDLFPLADQMREMRREDLRVLLPGTMGYNLFYQESTRTRSSFAAAMMLLGGSVEGTENARAFSSAAKGETLEDTVRILNGYQFDYVVLRYDQEGGALRAAEVSEVPIINAGDGIGQHPTQALLDVYTIMRELGEIKNKRVAMIGDLVRGRTVHSLAYLLAKFPGINMDFVSPPGFGVKQEIKDYLDRHNVGYRESDNLQDVLPEADVAYITRPQNNMSEGVNGNVELLKSEKYRIGLGDLSLLRKEACILHPLPRTSELPKEVDIDPRVAIFRQAQNGLYIRMALLYMINSSKSYN